MSGSYAIYILDAQSLEVSIKAIEKTEEAALEKMKELALDFIATEDGIRKAKIYTDFNHSDILQGYFLVQLEPNCIDVYYKKFKPAYKWFQPNEVYLNKIEHYSIAKLP